MYEPALYNVCHQRTLNFNVGYSPRIQNQTTKCIIDEDLREPVKHEELIPQITLHALFNEVAGRDKDRDVRTYRARVAII